MGCGFYEKNFIEKAGCKVWMASPDEFKNVAREGSAYDVCFEKRGNLLTTWVGSTKLMEWEMSNAFAKQAARTHVDLWVGGANPNKGVKLTLVELLLGKDLLPYQPTTQPESSTP